MKVSVLSNKQKKPQKRKKRVFKVIHVKSWRDIPCPPPKDSTLRGYSNPKTGTIYLVPGETKATEEHEKFHSIKRHPDFPRTYKTYIDHELEAWEYSWKKTGLGRHMKGTIASLFNNCLPTYIKNKQVTPHRVMHYIGWKINHLDMPDTWKEDYREVLKDFNTKY